MNIIDRIPRQAVPWVYLGVVAFALAMPASVQRDYFILGLGFGGWAVATIAYFAYRDFKMMMEQINIIASCGKAAAMTADQMTAERDEWKAECEKLRAQMSA